MDGLYQGLADDLKLHARQTAWLNTAPDLKDGKPGTKTRREAFEERLEPYSIPHISTPYLARWLYDIGPTAAGSMGEAPLSYRDLAAWQDIMGVRLLPWEAQTILEMSAAYLAERQRATDVSRPAPYSGVMDELVAKRAHVAKSVRAAFANLKKKEG